MQVGPSNRDYFFVGLTALNVAASLYGNHSAENVARALPLIFTGYKIATQAGNDRRLDYCIVVLSLYFKGFVMGPEKVSWKVHALAQGLIWGAHEATHASAMTHCFETLTSDKDVIDKISEGEKFLSIPLSESERKQLELSLYQNVLLKLDDETDRPTAFACLIPRFQFLKFEAYFSLYEKFQESSDLAKAWAYATHKNFLPDVVQCCLSNPDFEKKDKDYSLAEEFKKVDPTDPSYLFVLGYLYHKGEVKDIQSSVDEYLENLEKFEADSLTFYQVLGLSVAAALACEDQSHLMNALKVPAAEEEDLKPNTAEELLSKSYLIPKALKFFDTLSKNPSVSIPEKVKEIRSKIKGLHAE